MKLELTDILWAGNEVWRLVALPACVLGSLLAGWLARGALRRQAAQDAARPIRATLLGAASKAMLFLGAALGLELGSSFLTLDPRTAEVVGAARGVLLTLALAWLAYHLVDVASAWLGRMKHDASRMDRMLVPLVRNSLRTVIVLLTVVQLFTQLSGKPFTTLLAGLGLGGLALALAAQETIKNLFGSMVIFADKPFELGDRISVDSFDGPVERVGFRSTRLRNADGYLVTIPNGELANKTIVNISKRPYIRRVINLVLPTDTEPAQVQRALAILRDLLQDHEGQRPNLPPRVQLLDLTAAGLTIQALYWYHPPDDAAYLAFSERVNLELLRRFDAEGIAQSRPAPALLVGATPPEHGRTV